MTSPSLSRGFDRFMKYVRFANKHDVLESWLAVHERDVFGGASRLRVLDVGAGTGRVSRVLLELASRRGVTLELDLLEPCAEAHALLCSQFTAPHTVGHRIRAIDATLQEFQAEKQVYDLVLAVHSSYYFSDLASFVSLLADATRTGHMICVATSLSILQTKIYQRALPHLWANAALHRTFESDGYFTFAEQVESELVQSRRLYTRTLLPSQIRFPRTVLDDTICAVRAGVGETPVVDALGFLWRYETRDLVAGCSEWIATLDGTGDHVIPYEDIVLHIGALREETSE